MSVLCAAFPCHEQGASSIVFAPQHQLLISAGKKGDISILDVRQRSIRLRFIAHESPVKCLAIDPAEEFYVTGAADGDIKVDKDRCTSRSSYCLGYVLLDYLSFIDKYTLLTIANIYWDW